MGFGGRKHILPAPTESLIGSTAEESGLTEEAATDVSRRTDRTSATIPDDGSPVTITTDPRKKSGKHSRTNNRSQASLLIEFYEGAEETGSSRRPSLRVRVGPSQGKSKSTEDGRVVISQPGSRATSFTHRIPLTAKSLQAHGDSDISETEEAVNTKRGRSVPIDIAIGDGVSDVSRLSRSPEPRYIVPGSDISSMPAESALGPAAPPIIFAPPTVASNVMKSDVPRSLLSDMPRSSVSDFPDSMSDLKPPPVQREANSSRERLTQKAIEKISNRERTPVKSTSRHKSRSSSGDVVSAAAGERRRKSSRSYGEESSLSTGTDPSQVSASMLSAGARSGGQESILSQNSNITNPRLLQTVEDAIRRLILPELKEIKRNGSKRYTEKDSMYSESDNSIAREKESSRRVSSGSKSRRRSSKSSGSKMHHRERSHRDVEYDSVSDMSSPRKESVSSLSERYMQDDGKSHRTRNLAAGALAGGALTAAALHHRDSSSTLEQDRERRRRRKRSQSRSSRSASVTESEEIFEKHDVAPMPFRSDLDSELTRSSLLSSNTADTSTPMQHEVRDVARGSPFADSSAPHTPTRTSGEACNPLGLHHRNFSEHDLSIGRPAQEEQNERAGSPEDDYSPETVREERFSADNLLDDPERLKYYERNLHQQHPIRRGLSPIQSVASYATTEPPRNSVAPARSIDSIASIKRRQQALKEEVSMESFSSASPDLKKQARPQSANVESQRTSYEGTRDLEDDEYYDDQQSHNDKSRESYASSNGPRIDVRHMTNYTDDSNDITDLDTMTPAQPVNKGLAANPEYVHTPPGVESAVASLVEPSLLETNDSPRHSAVGSSHSRASQRSPAREQVFAKAGSPLKEQMTIQSPASYSKARQYDDSPPQSPARSFDENQEEVLNTPSKHKDAASPESEITTNPSVIQGPIGGFRNNNRDHWPYAVTPEQDMSNFQANPALNRDLAIHAPDLIPEALNVSTRNTYNPKPEMYTPVGTIPTPPGNNKIDEGYATGDTQHSGKNARRAFTPDDMEISEDPFVAKKSQYASGLSQGFSPLYDGATGKGRDRIQSRDIVALMDHLTVRDAQRNARDTEILVTLVQTAAEMRNSLEDVKKFIAEQGDFIVGASAEQHEKTQKIIGGPRPQPQPAPRALRTVEPPQDDLPTKRRNIFKRALNSLGSKNESELQNIEKMFMQLLDNVEELRLMQTARLEPESGELSDQQRSISVDSAGQERALTDTGYEPEGQAGTSSTGDRSGLLSGHSSRQANYRSTGRNSQGNRVSTVLEGNEDPIDYVPPEIDEVTPRASPVAEQIYRQSRGQSAPAETGPKLSGRLSQPWADDDMPQYPQEPSSAGRKPKSNTLSIFGKGIMSRWSKTTASSMPDSRFSHQRGQSYGAEGFTDYPYDPQAQGRPRSVASHDDDYAEDENRPPSPLVPSQVSENPKYQGYRNSQNLQHPQPRQGPTGRYQYRLETEAQTYDDQFSPTSQTSSQWENQMVGPKNPHTASQYAPQPPLSPISDTGYSETSERSAASSRRGQTRSRITNDEPLFPQRGPKGTMSPSTYVDQVKAARAGSPAYDKSPINVLRSSDGPQRKPSGPRPLSSSGSQHNGKRVTGGDLNAIKKIRFRGSPYQLDSE